MLPATLPRMNFRCVVLFMALFAYPPYPPSPSPKKRERCCTSLLNYITATSAIYLYSTFSELLVIILLFPTCESCFLFNLYLQFNSELQISEFEAPPSEGFGEAL